MTRSISKKLSEEPFKVPYPVASMTTASTPVEEVYDAKIIFNIFSSTNLYVFFVFFFVYICISFYLQLLFQLSLSYTATPATFQLFHPALPSLFLNSPSPSCFQSPCPTLAYWCETHCCEAISNTLSPKYVS